MNPKVKSIFRMSGRILCIVITAVILLLISAYGVMWILVNGPSPTARRLFVLSVKETSAAGFLADIYLSAEEIAEIRRSGTEDSYEEELDLSLISIPEKNTAKPGITFDDLSHETQGTETSSQAATETILPGNDTEQIMQDDTGIEVVSIRGQTYHGKMLIISDPKRVFVGVPDSYGENSSGLTVAAMIEKYGAVAGTNAGGFYDPNGQGTGGIPEGIVISEGKLLWGSLSSSYSIAGIDKDGILHVGNMTGQYAMDIGIQYAASFGPALVINGKAAGGKYGLGGGLNPRTAIGQRSDGAILLLVINGRTIDSLGATLDDLAAVMLEYGAVNATNLDGGSSSIMLMNGEYLTSSAYIFGERVVATAILVKP